MNNVQNTPINFTAKLDVRQIKYNKERWENIAKIFEMNTKKINDEFELSERSSYPLNYPPSLHLDAYTSREQKSINEHCADTFGEHMKSFYENSDETIAKKLEKLLRIFRREDKDKEIAKDFFAKIQKNDKHNDATVFDDKFWDIMTEKLDVDTRLSLDRDPVLKRFYVY